MTKLSKEHFEFLVNVALDSGDKEYFDSLIERQANESFDFSSKKEKTIDALDELTNFMDREQKVLARNVDSILKYHSKDPFGNFDSLADDLAEAILRSSERVDNKAEKLSKKTEEKKEAKTDIEESLKIDFTQIYLHDDETVEEMIARLLKNKELRGEIIDVEIEDPEKGEEQ